MARAIAVVAGLGVLAWALIIAAATAFGARRPDRIPWPDAGFRACDLPCWSHITPGRTAFSEVVPLLNRTLPSDARLLVSGSQVDFWTQAADAPFYGYLYDAHGAVRTMTMHVELPVGQLLQRLGAPGCVWTEEGNTGDQALTVYWETPTGMIAASVLVNRNHWGPNTRTQTLLVAEPYPACGRDAIQWRGFAPYTHYARWMADLR